MTKRGFDVRVAVLSLALLLSFGNISANERVTSMTEVREMACKAKTMRVDDELYIEGYVISKPYGHNNDVNIQIHYASLRNNDLNTVYVESLEGDVGFRLKLVDRKMARSYPRYSKVLLSLRGATLHYLDIGGVTIEGLTDESIVRVVEGDASSLPHKEKRISELTSDDLFTYVTLKDCELLSKDGSLSNVYEPFVQLTPINKKVSPNKSMDGWATLVYDKEGSSIYAVVNTLCRWRRSEQGVPQGSGEMRGIVSSVSLPRYGGDVLGDYVIFPVDRADFAMEWYPSSSYRSIAEWNWSDGKSEFNTESGKQSRITTEGVKANIGKGILRLDVKGVAVRGKDTNNTYIAAEVENDQKGSAGLVNHGSLTVTTEACNWWDWERDCGKGIVLEFSTKRMSGRRVIFGFTFAAGDLTAETSYGFPLFWGVEYSLDGKEWVRAKGAFKKLRTLPWSWYNSVNGLNNYSSVLAGAGLTEHMVVLPKSLLGRERVYVRVVPVTKRCATLGYDYAENGALRPNSMVKTLVNFGSFVVRYN